MKKFLSTIINFSRDIDFSKVSNMPIIIFIGIFLATGTFNILLDYSIKTPKKIPNKFNDYWFQFQYFNNNINNHWYSKDNITNINILLNTEPNGEIIDENAKKYLLAYSDYILTIEKISQNIDRFQMISKFIFEDISSIYFIDNVEKNIAISQLSKLPLEQIKLLKELIDYFNSIKDNSKLLKDNFTKTKKQLFLIKEEYIDILKAQTKLKHMNITNKQKIQKTILLETKLLNLIGKIQYNKEYNFSAIEETVLSPLNSIGKTFDKSMKKFNIFHTKHIVYIDKTISKNKLKKFIYTTLFGIFFFLLYVLLASKKKSSIEELDNIKKRTKYFKY